jgi:hypothetical protein
LAFEEFHGNEGFALMVFDGVNGADARMIQRRSGASFAEESL